MNLRALHIPFYIGLSIFLIGVLFKIQHYPGSLYCLLAGLITELVFVVFVIVEVLRSTKASKATKAIWAIGYPAIPIVAMRFLPMLLLGLLLFLWGLAYLNGGRKLFLFKRTMSEKFPFDSI